MIGWDNLKVNKHGALVWPAIAVFQTAIIVLQYSTNLNYYRIRRGPDAPGTRSSVSRRGQRH